MYKMGEVVITFLDSDDIELVYAACCVLLNSMAVQLYKGPTVTAVREKKLNADS